MDPQFYSFPPYRWVGGWKLGMIARNRLADARSRVEGGRTVTDGRAENLPVSPVISSTSFGRRLPRERARRRSSGTTAPSAMESSTEWRTMLGLFAARLRRRTRRPGGDHDAGEDGVPRSPSGNASCGSRFAASESPAHSRRAALLPRGQRRGGGRGRRRAATDRRVVAVRTAADCARCSPTHYPRARRSKSLFRAGRSPAMPHA